MKILCGLHLGWEQYGGHIAGRNGELTHSGRAWLRCTFEIDNLFLLPVPGIVYMLGLLALHKKGSGGL